jgi:hypothetical protein
MENETASIETYEEWDQKRGKSKSLEEKTGDIGAHNPHPISNLLHLGRGVRKERGICWRIRDQTQKEEDS